jgi:hypothetical protein
MPSTDRISWIPAEDIGDADINTATGPTTLCYPDWTDILPRCWRCDTHFFPPSKHRHRRRDRVVAAWPDGGRVAYTARLRLASALRRRDRRAARRERRG